MDQLFSPWYWHEARVLLVGLLIAFSCSILSVYVVLRRMAMISEGVSHAGIGGMGVCLFLGGLSFVGGPAWMAYFDQVWLQQLVTGAFCIGTALLIGYVSHSKRVHEDSAIGIFLVASVALGILLVQARSNMGGRVPISIEQLLFGRFAAVDDVDLIQSAAGAALVVTGVLAFYSELLYTTLDEDMARVNGVPTRFVRVLLLVLLSVVIVAGVRMVGFLMITALTILPGATASMLSRKFGGVLTWSVLLAMVTAAAVLPLAIKHPTLSTFPPGPILVLTLFALFAAVWVVRHTVRPRLAVGSPGDTGGAAPHGHSH